MKKNKNYKKILSQESNKKFTKIKLQKKLEI